MQMHGMPPSGIVAQAQNVAVLELQFQERRHVGLAVAIHCGSVHRPNGAAAHHATHHALTHHAVTHHPSHSHTAHHPAFQSHDVPPIIVAIDGQPCDPHEPDGGRILLGPAMRVDLALDMHGKPGERYRVIDDFYEGLSYWVTQLSYSGAPPLRAHVLDPPLALPPNPVLEPDLGTAE